jgi:outer membrane protein TolC
MKIRSRGKYAVVLLLLMLLPLTLFADENASPPSPKAGEKSLSAAASPEYRLPRIELDNLPEIPPGPFITLEEALEAADKNNLQLASGRIEIDKVEGRLATAYSYITPQVQGSFDLLHKDEEDSFNIASSMTGVASSVASAGGGGEIVASPQDEFKTTVGVAMFLIHPEGWASISAAKKGVDYAKMSVEEARQELFVAVSQAYYVSLQAMSLIELRESLLKAAAHHLKVASARFRAGTGLRIDVIRAETDMEQARMELLSAHMMLDNARDGLRYAIGSTELYLPVGAPVIPAPGGTDETLVDHAMKHHAEIKAKKLEVTLKSSQLKAAWMKLVPVLQGQWGLTYSFTQPPQVGSQDRARWALTFSLTVPLYSQQNVGAIKTAKAELRQLQIQKEDTKQKLLWDVRQARRDYMTALAAVEIATNQAKLAGEALTLVEAAFGAGTGSSLDLTDAQRTASQAAVNLTGKHLDAQISLIKLLRMVGDDLIRSTKMKKPSYYSNPADVMKSRKIIRRRKWR